VLLWYQGAGSRSRGEESGECIQERRMPRPYQARYATSLVLHVDPTVAREFVISLSTGRFLNLQVLHWNFAPADIPDIRESVMRTLEKNTLPNLQDLDVSKFLISKYNGSG